MKVLDPDFAVDFVDDEAGGVDVAAGLGDGAGAGTGAEAEGVGAFSGVGAGAGAGVAGLLPPMFRVIVGGGGGASLCSGLSMGAAAGGIRNFPGTNSAAPKLSLLMIIVF